MSGPNTGAEYFTRDDPQAFSAGAPVSAARAWLLRQNTQHVIDQTPQHRINWSGAAANDQEYVFSHVSGVDRYYSCVFVHTWLRPDWPCGLDIQVCGKTTSGNLMGLYARVVPHIGLSAGVLDVVDDPYWEDEGTTTSTTSTQVINSIYYPGTTPPRRSGYNQFTVFEGGVAKSVGVCLSRLDIRISRDGGTSETLHGLTRVSVREFC